MEGEAVIVLVTEAMRCAFVSLLCEVRVVWYVCLVLKSDLTSHLL